jgi:predicted DNA-binding mobile mystery protein A
MDPALREIIRHGLDIRGVTLKAARALATRPVRGWLRAARVSIGLSQGRVAKKLGVTRQGFGQMEEGENRGTISLGALQRAAEAMDCELVYFLIPKVEVASSFAELARLHDPEHKHLRATEHSMALEGQGVGDLVHVTPPPADS